MYGLPDSAIATSTRKAIRMARRGNRQYGERETNWGRTVRRWLERQEDRRYAKQRRQRLEKKHKVRFI